MHVVSAEGNALLWFTAGARGNLRHLTAKTCDGNMSLPQFNCHSKVVVKPNNVLQDEPVWHFWDDAQRQVVSLTLGQPFVATSCWPPLIVT